ncbi:hypothetical protein B0H16DRAFT_1467289 [Mycena metata]|uniref:Uncharacterized protein n=1 Tax=Mycena metata TaxID=1033252 RepID=A0AAD7I5Z6_9AGAR|nr:hypothetical protein B0H16DRAFT_1467289 [Mycena metata]
MAMVGSYFSEGGRKTAADENDRAQCHYTSNSTDADAKPMDSTGTHTANTNDEPDADGDMESANPNTTAPVTLVDAVDSHINSEVSSWHRSRRASNVGHGAVASVVVEASDHRTGAWQC